MLRPGDIAILVKKRSASQHVQRELLARGVRTLLDDQTNVFTTSEADDVRAVFEAMLSPTDTKKFATARATRLIGRTLSDIREDLSAAGAIGSSFKTLLSDSRRVALQRLCLT